MSISPIFLDCTLRDGGYYNAWDFDVDLINAYLRAMVAADVDFVEIGFRGFSETGFKGCCAFSKDSFLESLEIPAELQLGVMVNASELIGHEAGLEGALGSLFSHSSESPVELVRIACHIPEFEIALPAANWLKEKGYRVGFNLMQITNCTAGEMTDLAKTASNYPLDVLYFADSLGSMDASQTAEIISALRAGWKGALGIHTHDNLGLALSNTLKSLEEGVAWVDSTVTGMGRGPGNAKTEYLALEIAEIRNRSINIVPLMDSIQSHFAPMKASYSWGTNPYYYLAGKHGIHPTYIQEMLSDTRFRGEDILAVIEHLKSVGGKKFIAKAMEIGRSFYQGEVEGGWPPASILAGREVLVVGPGKSVEQHYSAIQHFIKHHKPFVIALNAVTNLEDDLIDARAACHPVRLLADCDQYASGTKPLITPASMLPAVVKEGLQGADLFDYGISVQDDQFEVHDDHCVLPTPLVFLYALAVASSANAARIYLAGFDGYGADDPRRKEVDSLFRLYEKNERAVPIVSITPTKYEVPSTSVYRF